MLRHAHPHLDAGKLVGAQMGDDVLQAVVAAGAAALADAQLAHRQRHIVGDHHHMIRRHLIEPGRLPHRFAGEVHVGLGLHHQYFIAVLLENTRPRLEAQLGQGEFLLLHQTVQGQPAHVVAGALILLAGIAQPHQYPVDAAALAAIEKHGASLPYLWSRSPREE